MQKTKNHNTCINYSRDWKEMTKGILVVHGVGNQKPLDTLRKIGLPIAHKLSKNKENLKMIQ